MKIPGRPQRLKGFSYDQPGPVFHVRIGCFDKEPFFANSSVAAEAVNCLRYYAATRIVLYAFCVMPDHVHVLLSLRREGDSLSRWVADFKRFLVRRCGVRFQPGFYEHVLRKEEALHDVARYIIANPLRAGLSGPGESYPWSGTVPTDDDTSV